MTVAELIAELREYDPSALVVIHTNGFSRGIYPANDTVLAAHLSPAPDGEDYHTAVLAVSRWPTP